MKSFLNRRSLVVLVTAGAIFLMVSATACGGPALQSFDSAGIYFEVSDRLTVEGYAFDGLPESLQRGSVGHTAGALASADGDFFLNWTSFQEVPWEGEVFYQVIQGADMFRSINPTISPKYGSVVVGDEVVELISGFEVHYAELEMETVEGNRIEGLGAAWWWDCGNRVFNLVTLDDDPKAELTRFVESFSCS